MSSELAVRADKLAKCYQIYDRPADRLKQMLWRGRRRYYREYWALSDLSFQVGRGEVLGVVGRNGAGKSTLLQLVCGTLTPSSGQIEVNGRIAALLELGAGFNPEFTGRENVYLNASILGMSIDRIDAHYDEIVSFSGIGDFIDQPVKTYSSGMYVRLAFSIATSVAPDILVVDEALSVGDGEFARKSFDRIMALRESGCTILFCSHALYQVEALCDRALWLEKGCVQAYGLVKDVVAAYGDYLNAGETPAPEAPSEVAIVADAESPSSGPRLRDVVLRLNDGPLSKDVTIRSRMDDLAVRVRFSCDLSLPSPSVGVVLSDPSGRPVASAGTHIDKFFLVRDQHGFGEAWVEFPRFPFLKGEYWVYVFLLCERGIMVYDHAHAVAKLTVRQEDLEQGVVSIPHRWHGGAGH